VSLAQVESARATLKNTTDQLSKQQHSYDVDPKSISVDALDNAKNAEKIAATNLDVVQRQYELTKAGAWTYDIQNQERTYTALQKAYLSSAALLAKYTVRAPADGIVLALHAGWAVLSHRRAPTIRTRGLRALVVMGMPLRRTSRCARTSMKFWCTNCPIPQR